MAFLVTLLILWVWKSYKNMAKGYTKNKAMDFSKEKALGFVDKKSRVVVKSCCKEQI